MALTLSLLLAGFAPAASASEYFGQRGQFFLGGASTLNAMSWTHKTYRNPDYTRNDLTFGLSPSVGLFVARNLFVGADLGFNAIAPGKTPADVVEAGKEATSKDATNNAIELSVGPRIGYNFDFGRGVSLMPSLGLGYGLRRTHGDNEHSVHADVQVPFTFQITHHGALLVGPTVRYSTTGDQLADPFPATVKIGLTGGLLIWI